MTAPGFDRSGTSFGERYALVRRLGVGGMGEVYLARHKLLGIDRALKVLRGALPADAHPVERLLREARALAAVDHTNVVRVHDIETAGGEVALAMEYVEGETLLSHIRRLGPLSPGAVSDLLEDIAAGLDAIHNAGILHRDLKPSNVLLGRASNGEVVPRIVDFGIARSESDEEQLTAPRQILGTPAYMSPEQAAGLPVDARSDVFSLTAVVAFMLAGSAPVIAPGGSPDLDSWSTSSAWPQSIRTVLNAGFQRFPPDRPSSAKEFALRFRSAVRDQESVPTRGAFPDRGGKQPLVVPVTEILPRELPLPVPARPAGNGWGPWLSVAVLGVMLGVVIGLL